MGERSGWRIAPILGVRDVRQAVDYYTGMLGFECPGGIFEGVAPGEGGVYAVVRRGEIEIHLQIRRGPFSGESREGIESDTYVFVSQVDALFEEFRAKGVVIHRAPENAAYGLRDFAIEDPEGHRLVFGESIGGSSPEQA